MVLPGMLALKSAFLLLITGFVIISGILFNSKYNEMIQYLKEYDFKLPYLYPAGLLLTEEIVLRFCNPYNRDLRNKIYNLFGERRIDQFIKLHLVQKTVMLIAVLSFISFLSLIAETGDSLLIFGLVLGVLSWYWVDKNLDYRLAGKKQEILIDLPGFINRLTMLVNAGLNFNRAVEKILADNNARGGLYHELGIVITEVKAGKPLNRAYEDFALRCGVPEITRFVSAVLQNLNRGGSDLVYVLKIIAQEAWGKRKDIARKQGEEASSKLVFPMVMIFLAVALIVLAPAMMTMAQ